MDKKIILGLVISYLLCYVKGNVDHGRFLATQRLQADIDTRIEPYARPVNNYSQPINVKIAFSMMAIDEVDELKQTIDYYGLLEMNWMDALVGWDPEEYDGITSLVMEESSIWTPDIELLNSIKSEYNDDDKVFVKSSGEVTWVRAVRQVAYCSFELLNYPHDTQTCTLKYGSWTYDNKAISITLTSSSEEHSADSQQNNIWTLVGTDVSVTDQTHVFFNHPCLTYTLHLKRYPTYHRHLIMAPGIMFALMMPVVFLLPQVVTDRILLSQILLLAANMITGLYMSSSPHTFDGPPAFGVYLLYTIVLTSMVCLTSCYIVTIFKKNDKEDEVPRFIKLTVLNCVGRALCISSDMHLEDAEASLEKGHSNVHCDKKKSPNEKQDEHEGLTNGKTSLNMRLVTSSAEWRQLADVLDRACFVLFSILISVPIYFIF